MVAVLVVGQYHQNLVALEHHLQYKVLQVVTEVVMLTTAVVVAAVLEQLAVAVQVQQMAAVVLEYL